MNLLTAEAKRLSWRRFVRITALLVLLVSIGFTLLTAQSSARIYVEGHIVPYRTPLDLDPYLYIAPLIACFGAGMIGATSIGAELSSGSISQWLTFNPDRSRVYGAKLTVVAVASGLLGLATTVVVIGSALASAAVAGRPVVLDTPNVWAVVLRGLILVILVGIAGFAMAALFGHTAAAPAAVAAWLVVALVGLMFGSQSRLAAVLSPDFVLIAFLQGSYTRFVSSGPWDQSQLTMTWPTALAILVAVVGLLTAASWVRFARRDLS